MPVMTVRQLMSALEEMDPEAEVRLAFQPSYPQEYSVDSDSPVQVELDGNTVVYIAEGRQIGGLNREAREELGWSR